MAQRCATQLSSNEADIQLAISSLKSTQIQSVNEAAQIFSVPEATLRRRRAGIPARRDCQPNTQKLTKLEEEVIVSYILNLDSRGFSPTYDRVRKIANRLLSYHREGQVGVQ
jgi:hypothetical protein